MDAEARMRCGAVYGHGEEEARGALNDAQTMGIAWVYGPDGATELKGIGKGYEIVFKEGGYGGGVTGRRPIVSTPQDVADRGAFGPKGGSAVGKGDGAQGSHGDVTRQRGR